MTQKRFTERRPGPIIWGGGVEEGVRRGWRGDGGGGCAEEETTMKEKVVRIIRNKLSGNNFILNYSIN